MHTPHGETAPQTQPGDPILSAQPVQPEPQEESASNPSGPHAPRERGAERPLPADLRTPLHALDLLMLVPFYLITGTVLFLLVATIAHYAFGTPFHALQNASEAKASVIIVSQALLSGATLAFLYVMVRSRRAAPFWPAVGWRAFRGALPFSTLVIECLLGGLVLAAATGWAGHFFDKGLVVPMDELFRNRQSVLLLMAMGILVAPAVEETIFRGCIYPMLGRWLGVGASVLITGTLFGLMHAPQLWPAFGQIGLLIAVGLILTYVRARTGTVIASFFVHLGYNSAVLLGYYFATGGLHHLPS